MAADSKDKKKDKEKEKKPKAAPAAAKKDKAPAGEKKEKAKKGAESTAAEGAGAEPKTKQAEAPPRPPADPRLKVLKKFQGRFLPKGKLRDRHKVLMQRWNSGEDHGGVTLEELKSLLDDWRASRVKQSRLKRKKAMV